MLLWSARLFGTGIIITAGSLLVEIQPATRTTAAAAPYRSFVMQASLSRRARSVTRSLFRCAVTQVHQVEYYVVVVVLQSRPPLPLDSGHDHVEADNAWTGDVPRHANGRRTGDGEIYYRRYSISTSSKYIRMAVATWRDDLEHLVRAWESLMKQASAEP